MMFESFVTELTKVAKAKQYLSGASNLAKGAWKHKGKAALIGTGIVAEKTYDDWSLGRKVRKQQEAMESMRG